MRKIKTSSKRLWKHHLLAARIQRRIFMDAHLQTSKKIYNNLDILDG